MSERALLRRFGRSRVPAPLAALLCAVFVAGLAWAVVVPPYQAPDETVHFAYVESLGARGKLPGVVGQGPFSTSQLKLFRDVNADPVVFSLYAKPPWSEANEAHWERTQSSLSRDDGGGPTSAATYPPAYYAFETLPYLAASGGSALDQLYVARFFSVFWLLVGTVAVWCLAGEIFGRRRNLQLAAAATYGLWPMICFISASVNPDGMLYALSSVVLWLGVTIIRRGLTPSRGLALGAVAGLACVTKAPGFALVPGALLALGWGAWRLSGHSRARGLLAAGAATLVLLLPIVAWSAGTNAAGRTSYAQVSAANQSVNVREFGSYLWQFYLPRLPFQTPLRNLYPVISDYPLYNTWLGTSWATFGWVNLWFPRWVYKIFLAISLAVLAGAGVAIVGVLRARPPGLVALLPALAFMALVAFCFLAGTHWSDYIAFLGGQRAFAQGRYLFPVAALAALVLTLSVTALPARGQPAAIAAWLGFLVVFQFASLGLVAARFYA